MKPGKPVTSAVAIGSVDPVQDDLTNPRKLLLGRIDLWAAGVRRGSPFLERLGYAGKIKPVLVFNRLRLYMACNRAVPDAQVSLWCAGPIDHAFLRECGAHFNVPLLPQCEGDLGARMAHCLAGLLETHERALLIGSDCPAFTTEHLTQAVVALDAARMVFTPAEDGGYVLVGTSNARHDNPSARSTSRSATSAANSGSCVATTTAAPAAANASSRRPSAAFAARSIPRVGSSSRIAAAGSSPSSTIASASR